MGKFTLLDIKPAPRGVPRIEVTLSININGILKVTAMDLSTKNKKEVLVTQSGLLADEEIERLKKESEKYREQDFQKKQIILKKNRIINYIYALRSLSENPKTSPDLKAECQELIEQGHREIDKENLAEIEKLEIRLAQMEEMLNSEILYDQQKSKPASAESPDVTKKEGREDTKPFKVVP